MFTVEQAFQHHKVGALDQAEKAYRALLANDANCVDAWQLLGALFVQTDRLSEAVEALNRAIQLRPESAQAFTNMGVALSRLERNDEAVAAYRQSILLQPKDWQVLQNFGKLLTKMKRYAESAMAFEEASKLVPENDELLLQWGVALIRSNSKQQAIAPIQQVLARNPRNARALKAFGQCLLGADDRLQESISCWTTLAELEPNHVGVLTNLASALRKAKRFDESAVACQRALDCLPDYFPALCNLGLIQSSQERIDEAIQTLQRACEIDVLRSDGHSEIFSHPAHQQIDEKMWRDLASTARCQLAALLNVTGHYDQAMKWTQLSLENDPNHVDSIMMKAFLHLQCGQFELGWPGYEYRKSNPNGPRSFPQPEWKGEDIRQKSILLHWEQGLGDTLQFIRYAKWVRARAAKVYVLVQASLADFLKESDLADQIIPEGAPLPEFDCHLPLMSLPFVFQSTMETLPRDVPYLKPAASRVDFWRNRIRDITGFKIGVAWQGNRDFAFDYLRRLELSYFAGIASIPGVTLFCLQKGDAVQQIKSVPFEIVCFDDLDENKGAFVDTAALVQNLDLVISPCTAVTHLAGALGKPVWLAKSFAAEWRWMNDDREENPWYPSMTMFRQPAIGVWEPVFERMEKRLRSRFDGEME